MIFFTLGKTIEKGRNNFANFGELILKVSLKEIFGGNGYRWMIEQSEYASDVLFKNIDEPQKH